MEIPYLLLDEFEPTDIELGYILYHYWMNREFLVMTVQWRLIPSIIHIAFIDIFTFPIYQFLNIELKNVSGL